MFEHQNTVIGDSARPEAPAFRRSNLALCLLLGCLASVLVACGSGQDAVEQMLEQARRGKDADEYWIGGSARQELYNVLSYEVLSEQPLREALQPHYDRTRISLEKMIADLAMKNTAHETQAEEHRRAAAEILRQIEEIIPKIESARERRDKAHAYLVSTRKQGPGGAHAEALKAWMRLEDEYYQTLGMKKRPSEAEKHSVLAVREDELAELALQESSRASEALANLDQMFRVLDGGVAYKVRVDSTNRAGVAIHILWTVTTLQTGEEGEWKITYMFDETKLSEAGPDLDMADQLLLMGGWPQERI